MPEGYHMACLVSDEGRPKTFYVHRILAELFIEPVNAAATYVNHKNLDKSDNSLENLEWVTPKENSQHYLNATKKITFDKRKRLQSVLDACARLDYEKTLEMLVNLEEVLMSNKYDLG